MLKCARPIYKYVFLCSTSQLLANRGTMHWTCLNCLWSKRFSAGLRHEAQAQLQLALLGVPEEIMEQTNEGLSGFGWASSMVSVSVLTRSLALSLTTPRFNFWDMNHCQQAQIVKSFKESQLLPSRDSTDLHAEPWCQDWPFEWCYVAWQWSLPKTSSNRNEMHGVYFRAHGSHDVCLVFVWRTGRISEMLDMSMKCMLQGRAWWNSHGRMTA